MNIQQNRKPKKMSHHHSVHIHIYEGEEDPKQHWFMCERMWDATNVTDDDKKIAQFAGALRNRALTWYTNFIENQAKSKDDIKSNFLVFFKMEDIAHLTAQKLKDIKRVPGESVWEYDKRFKYLLIQIPSNIDANLLVQWYVGGLLHHVRAPLRMLDIKTLKEAFKKSQQMESNVYISIPIEKGRLEEKIQMLHKTIRELSLQKTNIWCSNCREEGHTKDTCTTPRNLCNTNATLL